jgi:hypothetical protein
VRKIHAWYVLAALCDHLTMGQVYNLHMRPEVFEIDGADTPKDRVC